MSRGLEKLCVTVVVLAIGALVAYWVIPEIFSFWKEIRESLSHVVNAD